MSYKNMSDYFLVHVHLLIKQNEIFLLRNKPSIRIDTLFSINTAVAKKSLIDLLVYRYDKLRL